MTELIGPDGIFLRTADRKRFDYVLRGVREDSLSLALSSDNDGLLDHYGRLMINKLRKSDGLQIEVFLPQNTEALLERFNQILADLSIDEARNAETSQAPRRVLLAHDAKAISERDLQLLSRLVQDFPGANVSLVLLVDKPGILLHEKTLDKFGQRMLRWPLEAPTREEGEALIAVAGGMGFDVEAKKVLAATGYAKQPKPPSPAVGQAPDLARDQAPASKGKEDRKEEKTMSGAELAAMRQKALQDSSGRTERCASHADQARAKSAVLARQGGLRGAALGSRADAAWGRHRHRGAAAVLAKTRSDALPLAAVEGQPASVGHGIAGQYYRQTTQRAAGGIQGDRNPGFSSSRWRRFYQ
jgi:hypothetical protein